MTIGIAAGILAGFALLWRIRDCRDVQPERNNRLVTVIIPARNEEKVLPHLLASLQEQGAEILVADDHSTDATAAVAAQYGAKVLSVPPLPDGWQGKAWACWNGAQAATGELLLFLDADTVLEKEGVQRLQSCFRREEASLLSVHPFHTMKHPYEYISAFFHLVLFASMGAFSVWRRLVRPSGAFGQCLLCRREDYFLYGGHAAHRSAMLETFVFARHVQRQGGTVAHVSGRGAVCMRMYPDGISAFLHGWSKSFARGAASVHILPLLCLMLWINGMLAVLSQLTAPTAATWGLYAAVVLHWYGVLRYIGSFGIGTALLFPLHVIMFVLIFLLSVWKTLLLRKTNWKGRTVLVRKE